MIAETSLGAEPSPKPEAPERPRPFARELFNGVVTARVTLLLCAVVALPLLPLMPFDVINTATRACEYLVVALSVVLLIGMVGQISLAQASLVGMGAFMTAMFTLRWNVHFPFTLIVGMAAGALTAILIGVVALRVRGLFLAVATLIFAYICDQYIFIQPWLVPSQSGVSIGFEAIGSPGSIPYFDLGDPRVFYYVALAVAAFTLYSVANLRDSRIGRAFAAVRGSEVAAASLGIDVTRYKLLGFACSGALAGLAGSVIMVGQRNVAPDQFNILASLFFLSIAVVGGLRSPGGAIASALVFAVLVGEVFYRFPKLADYLDLVSTGLLIVVLLFFRGGLGALPESLRGLWRTRLAARAARLRARLAGPLSRAQSGVRTLQPSRPQLVKREEGALGSRPREIDVTEVVDDLVPAAALVPRVVPDEEPGDDDKSIDALIKQAARQRRRAGEATDDGRREPVMIQAEDVTVRFGGLTAVDGASIKVGAGEIVGLIGPNGAGKTTLFNSLLGLNQPATGRVVLYGQDVSKWPVHKRARLGVGRTFQILQLFGDLTVFDNLLVATHLQNRTGLFGSLFVTRRARQRESEARARVDAVLQLMDLEDVAHRRVAGLPFGVLRLVEVARTLVTGAPLVCFDEPASGLDSAETELLIKRFRLLREIGITVLVIEHDVSMVVRLCDYIYVLDQGKLIAAGTPTEIQRDPHVVASYLGTPAEKVG